MAAVQARRGVMEAFDQPTLGLAQRGDPAAFRTLVRTHERAVHALLGRMLIGRKDLVEDLAQETFLRVHRALPGFDPRGSAKLSTWILTIATRLAIDTLRQKRPSGDPAPLEAIADPSDLEAATANKALEQKLLRAMRELPDEARAVLVLRAFHDLDYPEIAAALGIEIGTVKSRLSRARAALQALIEERP
jgi:RNA polymerase sigma-70 factor, ECF subfamily